MKYYNQKSRITASLVGLLLGLTGLMGHGFFEVLQGNTATNGFFIEAISQEHKFWEHGTQQAFTVIPNFLITGICAILVSLAIIVWSVKYIQSKHGTTVYLSLSILLTLVGGGIGHIMLFLPTWAYATRINKPLYWWEKRFSERCRKILSKLWVYSLAATSISWIIEVELGVFGFFPGLSNPDAIMNTILILLFVSIILTNLTFICGIALDIEERN